MIVFLHSESQKLTTRFSSRCGNLIRWDDQHHVLRQRAQDPLRQSWYQMAGIFKASALLASSPEQTSKNTLILSVTTGYNYSSASKEGGAYYGTGGYGQFV